MVPDTNAHQEIAVIGNLLNDSRLFKNFYFKAHSAAEIFTNVSPKFKNLEVSSCDDVSFTEILP